MSRKVITLTCAAFIAATSLYLYVVAHSSRREGSAPAADIPPVKITKEVASSQRVPESPSRKPLMREGPPVATQKPVSRSVPHEKLERLLQEVNSRETALAYLDGYMEQIFVETKPPGDVPKITFVAEEDLSPSERERFVGVREKLAAKGRKLVITRVEGSESLSTYELPLISVEVLPFQVRAHLTDADLRSFQDKMMYWRIEQFAVRTKQQNR